MHDADKINRFNKKNGELAEAYFAAACLERGWQIFTPHGDSDPYDAIIVKGVLLHTIQIKSTKSVFKPWMIMALISGISALSLFLFFQFRLGLVQSFLSRMKTGF